MQANLRSRVAEMQMEFTREVEGIAAQVRLRDLQHNTKEGNDIPILKSY